MRITLQVSDAYDELDVISSPFSFLTNMAEICVDDILYDATNGIVEIPMKRRETIKQSRKGCLAWWQPPYIAGQNLISSSFTIRQVVGMKVDVDNILKKECNSRFTVMLGITVERDKVYLCSLEEASGKTLCKILISVKGIDLEIVDQR